MLFRPGIFRASAALAPAGGGGGTWSDTIATGAMNADVSDWEGYTVRFKIPAATWTASGTKIRLTLRGPTVAARSLIIDKMYIGPYDATGATDVRFNTATQITFAGGASGTGTIVQNGTLLSDEITFTLDESLDYILSFYCNATTADGLPINNGAGNTGWTVNYKLGDEAALTGVVSGYGTSSGQPNNRWLIGRAEVFN